MVRRTNASRLEFDAAAVYEYPEHLRPWLDGLPKACGVYVFHGESDVMPLYIGKSVNIRTRVISHFRTPDETALLRQSRRITFVRTAGELGALLLETQMIKVQQPLFNKRRRRNRQLCSLNLQDQTPRVVDATRGWETFLSNGGPDAIGDAGRRNEKTAGLVHSGHRYR